MMNVSLTPELEEMVAEKVRSGMYSSASEVVRDALRLLREQDVIRAHRLAELRREVQIGLDQVARGEVVSYDSIADAVADIEVRGLQIIREKGLEAKP